MPGTSDLLRTTLCTVVATAALGGLAPTARAAGETDVPDCVHYASDWRYTTVLNDCDITVELTVEYTDGTQVPCRVVAPAAIATFPGYGPGHNDVTGLRACTRDAR
ncbi:alpha-amylase [Streptomyces fructofermentans]|uniref:Alpha-amylase n=1 Tax=Streptomyces fructofermentans TaxID=152141 RepID=A0A918KDX3_9ACTN|nr:alpha-amylase [Streptomyces fructofermentans]GGX57869.1 hypothetical protein GCM10010515_26960 [Streptomyces fructofermentans]